MFENLLHSEHFFTTKAVIHKHTQSNDFNLHKNAPVFKQNATDGIWEEIKVNGYLYFLSVRTL